MKIGFLVNDLATERPGYTTTYLALAARARGHETWHIGVADLALTENDQLVASAISPPVEVDDPHAFVAALREGQDSPTELDVGHLDALLLRNDPATDREFRPWACLAGVNFGRFAEASGVLVLNSPAGLDLAINKLYLQHFPAHVRPKAIVSRHVEDILGFIEGEGTPCVIKPLSGSGGHDVFVLDPADPRNTHQMIEAVTEDGFALVQAFVEGASAGDIRLFMLEGEILRIGDQAAIIRRRGAGGDIRHNLTAGGKARATDLTPAIEHLATTIGPKLKADGIFLAGIDIVGDKILEINVFSPGALVSATRIYGVDFEAEVIKALERRRRA